MDRLLGDWVHPIAKAIEKANIRAGYGEFGVPDEYKCIVCHDDPSSSECPECRTAWVRELGHIDYSDAFERRANIGLGIICLSVAASSWLLNNAFEFWEFGPFMASLNAVLLEYTPDLDHLPTTVRSIYLVVLGCVFGVSMTALWMEVLIAMFIFCINPTGTRTYKHMTPSAICTIAVLSIVYLVVLLQRVYVIDGLFVVLPTFTGVLALALVPCMRKTEENGNGSGIGKLI